MIGRSLPSFSAISGIARTTAATSGVLLAIVSSLSASACSKKDPPNGNGVDAAATALSVASADAAAAQPARGTPVPKEVIAATVNPENLPVYTGPTGSVEGRVTVIGDRALSTNMDFSKCPAAEKVYGKTFREGDPLPDGSRPLADALIVVTGYSGFFIPEKEEAKRVDIVDCAISPRTLDLTFGQRIEIGNKTPAKLFGPELSNHPMPALMVTPYNADPVKIWPKTPGFAQVMDRLGHPFIVLDVYTLLQPLHAVTKPDGTYRIDGVPVGKLDVNARMRAINKDVSKPVEIRSNVVARVDLQMEYRVPDAGSPVPPTDAGASKVRIK